MNFAVRTIPKSSTTIHLLGDEIITRLWQTDTDLCPPKTLHGEGLSFRTSSQITVSGKSLTSLYARGLKLQLAQAESSTKIAQQK